MIQELLQDTTTDDTFGLLGTVVTPGNKVQELAVLVLSRTFDLNTSIEIFKINTSKATGREHQYNLQHLLSLNSNIRETWRNIITKTGISCELCCIDILYTVIIKKVFLKCLYWEKEIKQVGWT